ncbi:MAG: (p)ppGpp synthase/HD superfamily hydrolase [Alteromonadaceae bacterium]|jgi:(p)ppGpp synthase/HD superfamily hydrolase
MNSNEIIKTIMFAAEAHRSQRRKGNGGSPYINHLIEVAGLLSDIAKVTDVKVIQAGILHNVLEDTNTTENELYQFFWC